MTHVPITPRTFAFVLAPVTQYTPLTPHTSTWKQDVQEITFLIDRALERNCKYIHLQICNLSAASQQICTQEFRIPNLDGTGTQHNAQNEHTVAPLNFLHIWADNFLQKRSYRRTTNALHIQPPENYFKQGWILKHGHAETHISLQTQDEWHAQEARKSLIMVDDMEDVELNPYSVLLQSATPRL